MIFYIYYSFFLRVHDYSNQTSKLRVAPGVGVGFQGYLEHI